MAPQGRRTKLVVRQPDGGSPAADESALDENMEPTDDALSLLDDSDSEVSDRSLVSSSLSTGSTANGRHKADSAPAAGQKRKHKCLMSSVNEIISMIELCTKDSPLEMAVERMKLHYFIHYMKRGVWDPVCPEPSEQDKKRIEAYVCRLCKKKFKNALDKKEYPARGSFICHYATDHGKLVEVMREDDLVDMTEVLDILRENDPKLRPFIEQSEPAAKEDSSSPVETVWAVAVSDDEPAAETRQATPAEVRPEADLVSLRQPDPVQFSCPRCPEMKQNKSAASLRLHLFHHYLEYWDDKLPAITGSESLCSSCSPPKKIVGANLEGCRIAVICHLAIQHEQLREALSEDSSLSEDFIRNLYSDAEAKERLNASQEAPDAKLSNSNSSNGAIVIKSFESIRSIMRKKITEEAKKRFREDVKMTFKSKNSVKIRKKAEHQKSSGPKMKKSKKNFSLSAESWGADSDSDDPGMSITPQPYVRKRIKQNLAGINFDEDSDEDMDWKVSSQNKNAKGRKKSPEPDVECSKLSLDGTRKVLPKRKASTLSKSLRELDSEEEMTD